MILYLWDKKETMERQVYKSELMIKEIESKRILDKKTETTISLRGLEKILPLSKATLSRVMNGSNPDIESLAALSKWVGKPMEYFFKTIKSK